MINKFYLVFKFRILNFRKVIILYYELIDDIIYLIIVDVILIVFWLRIINVSILEF